MKEFFNWFVTQIVGSAGESLTAVFLFFISYEKLLKEGKWEKLSKILWLLSHQSTMRGNLSVFNAEVWRMLLVDDVCLEWNFHLISALWAPRKLEGKSEIAVCATSLIKRKGFFLCCLFSPSNTLCRPSSPSVTRLFISRHTENYIKERKISRKNEMEMRMKRKSVKIPQR